LFYLCLGENEGVLVIPRGFPAQVFTRDLQQLEDGLSIAIPKGKKYKHHFLEVFYYRL
jgi:hypothetical protein